MKLLLSGIIIGIFSYFLLTQILPKECVEGTFVIKSPTYGSIIVGDQSICGYHLSFTSMVGPSKYR